MIFELMMSLMDKNVVKIWAPSYIRSGSFAVLTLEKDIWDQVKNHFISENYQRGERGKISAFQFAKIAIEFCFQPISRVRDRNLGIVEKTFHRICQLFDCTVSPPRFWQKTQSLYLWMLSSTTGTKNYKMTSFAFSSSSIYQRYNSWSRPRLNNTLCVWFKSLLQGFQMPPWVLPMLRTLITQPGDLINIALEGDGQLHRRFTMWSTSGY